VKLFVFHLIIIIVVAVVVAYRVFVDNDKLRFFRHN